MRIMLIDNMFGEKKQGLYKHEWLNFKLDAAAAGHHSLLSMSCDVVRPLASVIPPASPQSPSTTAAERIFDTYVLSIANTTSSSTSNMNIDNINNNDDNIANMKDNKDNNRRSPGTHTAALSKSFYTLPSSGSGSSSTTTATTTISAFNSCQTLADGPPLFGECIKPKNMNINDEISMSYLKNLGAECSNKTNTLNTKMMIDNDCGEADGVSNGAGAQSIRCQRSRTAASVIPAMFGFQHIRNTAVLLLLIISSFPVFCSGEFAAVSACLYTLEWSESS